MIPAQPGIHFFPEEPSSEKDGQEKEEEGLSDLRNFWLFDPGIRHMAETSENVHVPQSFLLTFPLKHDKNRAL